MLRLVFLPQRFFFFNLSGICFFNWPVKRRKKKKKKEKERKKKRRRCWKKRKKVEEKNQEAQLFSPWPRRCQKNRKIIPTLFDAKDYLAMKSKSWLEVVRACFLEPGHTQAFGNQTWAFMPSLFLLSQTRAFVSLVFSWAFAKVNVSPIFATGCWARDWS